MAYHLKLCIKSTLFTNQKFITEYDYSIFSTHLGQLYHRFQQN